jgi:hypothetical protein
MADLPISGLPAVVTPASSDEFAVAQAGITKKATGTQIADYAKNFAALTQNSVLFAGASGEITENNSDLSWDDTAKAFSAVGTINAGTSTSDASAILQASSTTQGFLPPVMTEAQRDAITTPSTGLIVFNTDTNHLNVKDSASWEGIARIHNSTQANTATGPWASAQGMTLKLQLIDNVKVVISFNAVAASATTNSLITLGTAIPAAFRPSSVMRQVVSVFDNDAQMFGMIEVNTGGIVKIGVGPAIENFTGVSTGGDTGLDAQSFTYDITV